ncbi:unnamed protein product [Arabidopsis halleri]
MTLEEEEEDLPFELPNLPEFMSMERNAMSLAGRIRKSVSEVEKDPIAKKSILRLETPLLVHPDAKKDKGIVFDYGDSESLFQRLAPKDSGFKESSHQVRVNYDSSWLLDSNSQLLPKMSGKFFSLSQPFQDSATVDRPGFFEAGPSGTILS